jgi:hypothetical protein
METVDKHGTFEETLVGSTPEVEAIAWSLRRLIIELYPQVVEVPWPKQAITGYGVGPKKMTEHFCYIGVYRRHVNLGFYQGAHIADPQGLLAGSGKNLRHIKVTDIQQVARPAMRQLVLAAITEREVALG